MASISKFPSFYFVDKDYHRYLQSIDKHITNIEYANREKFVFGVVFETSDKICYFVPVSSYSKAKENNIQIKINNNGRLETVGSLRFNYMFPVPRHCLTPVNFKDTLYFNNEERIKVEKEYLYLKKKIGIKAIQKKAKETYAAVLEGKNEELVSNSCNFRLLEEAYRKYIRRENFGENLGQSENQSSIIPSRVFGNKNPEPIEEKTCNSPEDEEDKKRGPSSDDDV